MDIKKARKIYTNLNGYTKAEQIDCIMTLNEFERQNGIGLNPLQILALTDASMRLGHFIEKN